MTFLRLIALCCGLIAVSPAGAASSPELLKQGEYVARAGDCIVCHSGEADKPFAGGLKMGTPVGAIYTTNITPDKATGIGAYTFEDFDRAMRKGVAKDGRRLFPAMPYPSYANMTAADMKALYAFIMEEIEPVARTAERKELWEPINKPWILNMGLAAWQALFVDADGFKERPGHNAAWNRGAYLVEGLGHCGSCHTPRGIFFQEKGMDSSATVFLSGAELDYWSAPNLRPDGGLGAWTEEAIAAFLKTGHTANSAAFGTMVDVINNSTQYLTDTDLAAMAGYIKTIAVANHAGKAAAYEGATANHLASAEEKTPGERVYVRHCATCHGIDGKGQGIYIPALFGNTAVLDPNPSSLINLTLNGSQRIVQSGTPDFYRMVQFRKLLSDQQIADVVTFIRSGWGNAASAVTAAQVTTVRKYTDPASEQIVILKMR